jgi:hypothetical protein
MTGSHQPVSVGDGAGGRPAILGGPPVAPRAATAARRGLPLILLAAGPRGLRQLAEGGYPAAGAQAVVAERACAQIAVMCWHVPALADTQVAWPVPGKKSVPQEVPCGDAALCQLRISSS